LGGLGVGAGAFGCFGLFRFGAGGLGAGGLGVGFCGSGGRGLGSLGSVAFGRLGIVGRCGFSLRRTSRLGCDYWTDSKTRRRSASISDRYVCGSIPVEEVTAARTEVRFLTVLGSAGRADPHVAPSLFASCVEPRLYIRRRRLHRDRTQVRYTALPTCSGDLDWVATTG
jgi:hypothetical protein